MKDQCELVLDDLSFDNFVIKFCQRLSDVYFGQLSDINIGQQTKIKIKSGYKELPLNK